MKLKVRIEKEVYPISVGFGLNDFAWLAMTAAKLYGQTVYPHGNYIPVLLKAGDITPHPREKIIDVFKGEKDESMETLIFDVWIQQPNMKWTEEHQTWFDRAFGKDRNKMVYRFAWIHERKPEQKEKERKAGVQYFVRISYKIFNEVCYEFNPRDFETHYDLPLKEREHSSNFWEYSAEKVLPFGDVTPEYVHWSTPNQGDGDAVPSSLPIHKISSDIRSDRKPTPMSQADVWKKIKDHKKEMEIQLQKEAKEERTEDTGNSLCPYNFETIWKIITNSQETDQNFSLEGFETNVDEKIKGVVTENLNKLYEIFLQYSFLYQQQSEKRDEICITVQDVMHFLKFYQVCHDNQLLFECMESYDVEKKLMNNFKITIDINHGIRFPEFVLIILKSVLYLQQINILSDSEEYAKILSQVLKNVVRIDSNEEEMNEFQKHMKFNFTLINFLRENSEKLINVFLSKVQESMQVAERKFHMVREDIRTIIIESGFKGDNLEDIITSCFHELYLDVFQGHDGMFYFEFLQILQWLSLVLVSETEIKDDLKEDDEMEEGIEGLIEKLKFLIFQIKV